MALTRSNRTETVPQKAMPPVLPRVGCPRHGSRRINRHIPPDRIAGQGIFETGKSGTGLADHEMWKALHRGDRNFMA
jgi:hypothetical protein